MRKILIGNAIETLACAFLEGNELECVEKNFSCRLGEIDLIMFEASSDTLVFVEVRFRSNVNHGNATESVDWKKQRKLRRTVLYYLQKNATARTNARIDVIGVSKIDTREQNMTFSAQSVSQHYFENHLLTWTQNAIEDA